MYIYLNSSSVCRTSGKTRIRPIYRLIAVQTTNRFLLFVKISHTILLHQNLYLLHNTHIQFDENRTK